MREITYAQALNEALAEEMRRDPNVFCIGCDLIQPTYGVTRGLYEEFGANRVVCTPISEAAIAGAAVGASVTGTRPVAEIMYMDFSTIASDQIVNQAAKMRYMFGGKAQLPMVIRMPSGAGRGNAAQHMQSLEAWYIHIPGLKVVQPTMPYDAKGLLKSAIRDNNPVIFIEGKLLYQTKGPVPEEEYLVPLGVADVKRQGNDITIVAAGHRALLFTLEAAEQLAKDGIDAEVIDPRTLVPMDFETIFTSVRKTHRAAIVHEAVERGGIGGWITAQIQEHVFDYLDGPIVRITGTNTPVPFAAALEAEAVPNTKRIVAKIKEMLGAGVA
jgi:pyruvate/2-oxoglutarate/acetoin dehydrogenase E1 component